MITWKKLVATAVLALATLSTVATANLTAATERSEVSYTHHHHDVYYRGCEHEPWKFYRSFNCSHEANDAAAALRNQGYQTSVRCHD